MKAKTKKTKENSMASGKSVRVTIEMDSQFIRLLNSSAYLNNATNIFLDQDRQMTPIQILAALVLAEARGELPEKIYACTPNEWVDDIKIIHDERRVYKNGELVSKNENDTQN